MAKYIRKSSKKKTSPLLIVLIVLMWILIFAAIAFAAVFFWLKTRLGTAESVPTGEQMSVEDLLKQELGVESISELIAGESEEIQNAFQTADTELAGNQDTEQLELSSGITNYLLIGSDSRDGGYGNSDTMIMVTINNDTGKIHLTSFMRAMYVAIPSSSGGSWNGMLNWAYNVAGPERTVATIENNFKVDIEHYFVVDFQAFEKVVDTLGGVTIELDESEASAVYKWSGEWVDSGVQLLDGAQTLGYCRDRHDNDFNRTRRQRNTIQQIITQLKGSDVETLTEVANNVLPYITTDMPVSDILAELTHAVTYLGYEVDQRMLPIENEDGKHYTGITTIDGHEMYIVDWSTNLPALEEFLNS